jgi:PAS domain S-box-containing protein
MCAREAPYMKAADGHRGGIYDNKDIGEYLWSLAKIMENAPMPFAICFNDGRLMNCNHAFTELTGYTKDELFRMDGLHVLTPQKFHASDIAATEALCATGRPQRYEKEIIRQDGSRAYIDVFYHLISDGNEKPKFYYFFMSDVSKRMSLEEELKQIAGKLDSERLRADGLSQKSDRLAMELDVTLLSLVESIAFHDINGIMLRANPAAVKCLGFNPVGMDIDTLNRRISFRYPDGQKVTMDESPQLLAAHGDNGAGGRFMLTNTEGRNIAIVLSASPLYFGGRICGAMCVWHDVTEHERMLEQIEKERRLLQDSKMQMELYLDLMSHDIININQIGMGYLELALDLLKPDDELHKLLHKALESFLNSSKLIDNVGKIKRFQSTEARLEAVDIGEMLGDVRNDYLGVDGREVTISYVPVKGCHVMANDLLRDVFLNILDNSVKHSSGPLSIDIALSRAFENGQAYYKVTIEDDGPGIPDELKSKIFIRFQKNMVKARGKGIGLYLVKSVLEGFRGRIWVEDRFQGDYTKGSRFVVMLPAVIYN